MQSQPDARTGQAVHPERRRPRRQLARQLTAQKVAGGIQFCWNAYTSSCFDGYHLLGSNDVTSEETWTTIATTGEATTCWTGNPTRTFYLVVAHGEGGDGPKGHY